MLTLEELKKLDTKKLEEELEEARKTLFKARFEIKSGQAKANHKIANDKKYIARIQTVLNSTK